MRYLPNAVATSKRLSKPSSVVFWLALALALPAAAAAQDISLNAAAIGTDHELLSGRLVGAAARLRFPIHDGPVSIRLGVERLAGNFRRTGVPCAGLVEPGTCQPEPTRDDARFAAGSAGVGVRVIEWRRVAIDLTGDLSFANIDVDTRGLASGRMLSATKDLWEGDVGIEGAWSPWKRLPFALQAGFAAGHLWPVVSDAAPDAYTPFERGFELIRLRFGFAWRLPSQ